VGNEKIDTYATDQFEVFIFMISPTLSLPDATNRRRRLCLFEHHASPVKQRRVCVTRKELNMISVSECAAEVGLASNELVLGAVPSAMHDSLLTSYLLNSHRGLDAVRAMIVADLRRFLDLGVPARAADLLIVLRLLLTDHPQARRVTPRLESRARSERTLAADFEALARGREPAVVLSFARRERSADRRAEELRPYLDRAPDPLVARRGARSFHLRSE
jgi:hypothetical protein